MSPGWDVATPGAVPGAGAGRDGHAPAGTTAASLPVSASRSRPRSRLFPWLRSSRWHWLSPWSVPSRRGRGRRRAASWRCRRPARPMAGRSCGHRAGTGRLARAPARGSRPAAPGGWHAGAAVPGRARTATAAAAWPGAALASHHLVSPRRCDSPWYAGLPPTARQYAPDALESPALATYPPGMVPMPGLGSSPIARCRRRASLGRAGTGNPAGGICAGRSWPAECRAALARLRPVCAII